jgi:UPF0176 protein
MALIVGRSCLKVLKVQASKINAVNTILNIAAYKFVPIPDPESLQQTLQACALDLRLKGTVLIASEGINLFLAGSAAEVRRFVDELRADLRFSDLQTKESWSQAQPFKKMRVRVKAEIIRMNQAAIAPAQGRAPAVSAATLKRWLDQGHDDAGKPLLLLDTRNAFEVDHGTFHGALDWRIEKFTEFPQAFARHQDQLKDKTVVSFCTGGIRCEKAALLMREAGVEPVYQLEGGILKYFEDAGGAHFSGHCFVFDERRTLDADLSAKTGADLGHTLAK